MKPILFAFGLAISSGCLSPNYLHAQSTFQEKYFREGMYFFDDLKKITENELFTTFKKEFSLRDFDEMVPTNNIVQEDGSFKTKYVLYHKGIPVEGSLMNVKGDKGVVLSVNGAVIAGLSEDVYNLVTKEEAIEAAIAYVDAKLYPWQDSIAEAGLKAATGNSDTSHYPNHADLIITKKRGEEYDNNRENYQICYRVVINAIEPASMTNVYVNANTGEVFTSQSATYDDYAVTGTLWTWYNGWHNNMTTTRCALCFNFWLDDLNRKIFTRYYPNSKISDANNNWVENYGPGNSSKKSGATAHWSVQRAWDYYYYRHGRWGADYNGREVNIKIDANLTPPLNAVYNFNTVYGDDQISLRKDNGHSAAMLDVLAHEYTHAMIQASSELGATGFFDSRSLNEAICDIFGMRIEGYTSGWYDWTFAENMATYQRNFANPHNDFPTPSPSIYLEPGYWSSTDPYLNGGIMRKWYHLLSNGGFFNGHTLSGIGIEEATDIIYTAFNWWFWSTITYPEAASQIRHAVATDWGTCSDAHVQTILALRAIGFNLPIPWCIIIKIGGPKVITPSETGSWAWKANLNDIEDKEGVYTWSVPDGWTAKAEGNTLTATGFSNTMSQKIGVTYTTTTGEVYSDTAIVHFSDMKWEPTNHKPPSFMSSISESVVSEDAFMGVELYPNPAHTSFSIKLPGQLTPATIEIYDINGRLVKTMKVDNPLSSVDVSNWARGIYMVKISTSDKTVTQKLSLLP